jgi:hypothetical protein
MREKQGKQVKDISTLFCLMLIIFVNLYAAMHKDIVKGVINSSFIYPCIIKDKCTELDYKGVSKIGKLVLGGGILSKVVGVLY